MDNWERSSFSFTRKHGWTLREIAQREVGQMLHFESADHIRELPLYFCPTCGAEIKQQASYPAERNFIPIYCSSCGQKLEPYVTGDTDYPDDLFFSNTAFVPTSEGADVSVSKETESTVLGAAGVDSIEEGVVRIVYSASGATAVLPLVALPDGIREGDVVYQQNGVWQLDAAAGPQKKDELKGRLNRLLDRDTTTES